MLSREYEWIGALIFLVFWLGLFALVLYFSFRAFFRSQKHQREGLLKAAQQLQNALQQIQQLVLKIRANPIDSNAHDQLRQIALNCPQAGQNAFEAALLAVELSGGVPATKTLALLTGRLYYGSLRENGLVTVYDENAILNDINARVGREAPKVDPSTFHALPPSLPSLCPRCQTPLNSAQILGVDALECPSCGFSKKTN
jgi:hypothetical protein